MSWPIEKTIRSVRSEAVDGATDMILLKNRFYGEGITSSVTSRELAGGGHGSSLDSSNDLSITFRRSNATSL